MFSQGNTSNGDLPCVSLIHTSRIAHGADITASVLHMHSAGVMANHMLLHVPHHMCLNTLSVLPAYSLCISLVQGTELDVVALLAPTMRVSMHI